MALKGYWICPKCNRLDVTLKTEVLLLLLEIIFSQKDDAEDDAYDGDHYGKFNGHYQRRIWILL